MKAGAIITRDSNQKGNSNTASKNVGSFVKIDSISIDLEDASDKSFVEKCEHFSIRGYVAEVRTKNWQLCWPFSLGDEQNKSEEQKSLLPPLDAPKFRWWSCQSCLQDVGSRGTAKDYGTEFNSCTGSKASSTCSQMPSLCDSVMPFPDARQTPKPTEVEKRESDVYTSTDANGNIQQLSLCSDKKEESASEAHTTIIGLGNGSENDAVHEIPRLTFVPPEINSNVLQEEPKHCTGALDLAGSKPKDQCKNSCGKHEVPDIQPATNMGMCTSSSKTCQTEKQNSLDERQRDLKIASGVSVLACLNEEAGNVVTGQTNGSVSEVSDECDNASSDSVQILVGNTLQDQNHSLLSGSQRRKTRKVRLLTELLLDNGDAKTDHVSGENSPPNAIINDASAGAEIDNVPKDHVSLPENCGEDLDDIKKRKMPLDEEGRSPEMSSLNNRSKKSNNFKGSEEVVNEIAVAELEQDASAGLYLQSSTKSSSSKYGNDNIPITGKKKNKKNQTIDAPSTLVPIGESLPGQILDQVGSPSKGNIHDSTSSRLVKAASISRRLDKNPLAAPRKEKKSSLLKKKKSKMTPVDDGRRSDFPFLSWPKALSEEETPVDDGQTSEFSFFTVPKTLPKEKTPQFPWNGDLQKKDTAMRNEEIMQTGPAKVSFAQAEDAPVDTGLHLSLGSYFPTNEFSNNEIQRTNVDANYKCDSSLSSKPASYALFNKRVHNEFGRNVDANNIPIQSRAQKNNSQVEEACYPLVKQVDISGARNCDKAIKVKEHSSVSRKNADRIAASVSDPGAWDDIPMEIVELMARNQYERRLENAENNKRLLKMANEGGSNQIIDYDRVYGSGELGINEDTSQRRNPRARNGKNGINAARKGVQSAKQKAVDYISNIKGDNFDIYHLGQKSSSGVQIPVHSSKCSCAQNCNWNRDMVGHEFLNAGMQIEPCEKCPTVSQPREGAAHLWPSTLPLRMPPRYNIPPMVASQPTNLDYLMKHDPRILNLNMIGHEKHNQNSGSETFSRRSAEYLSANKHNGIEPQQNLIGSLDLYSNETIPAMHLLSLMDAGMQSGPSLNTGGNSKFLKRVGPVDHNPEYSRPEFGVYSKPSNSMKHPLGVYSKPSDTMNHPLNYYAKNKLPEKSHDFFPLNPTVGPSTSSFHHDKGFERANDFMGQVSSSSRKKEKVQTSSLLAQNRGRRPPNSMFASDGLGTNHNVIPAHGLHKGSFGASASMVLPLQLHTAENSTKLKLEAPHNNGTFWPPKISPESTICSINRNPADFGMPEAGNEYMIRGEDLKFRKPRKRPCLLSVDQRKRQKNIKRSAEKANAQH